MIDYDLFGGIADKRKLLKDEADEHLSEIFERKACEARDCESDRLQHAAGSAVLSNPRSPSGGAGTRPAGRLQWSDQSGKLSLSSAIEEFFNDPMLTRLIQQALVGNRELKILDEEVQIARNEILSRQGAYLPFVTVGAGGGLDKYSRYTLEGASHTRRPLSPRQEPSQSAAQFPWQASTSPGSWTSGGSCGMPGTRQQQRYLAAM